MWKKLNRMKSIYRISVGLHVELSGRFFSLVLVHWSSLDPELCLIFRDIYEYRWRIHRLSNCSLSENFTEFFRKQETSCFRGKRNDSPPSKQSCYRPTISPLLLNPRRSRLLPAGHHWSELQGDQISPGRTPGHRASPPAGTKTTLWVPPVRTPPVLKPEIPAWKKTHDKLLLRYHLIANKSWPEQDKGTPHPPAPER